MSNAKHGARFLQARRLVLLGFNQQRVQRYTCLSANQIRKVAKELEDEGYEIRRKPGPSVLTRNIVKQKDQTLEASLFTNVYIRVAGFDHAKLRLNIEHLITAYREYKVLRSDIPGADDANLLTFDSCAQLIEGLRITDLDDVNAAILTQCNSRECGAYHYVAIQQRNMSDRCPFCSASSA